jgi:hypothetical protein
MPSFSPGFETMAPPTDTRAATHTAPERSGERLSALQKQILTLAYDRINEPLYYSEILEEVYGFPPAVGGEHSPGSIRFDRQAIGPERYNAAQAALSRAMSRLHDRGLIECLCGSHSRWSGCSISGKGQRLIRTMLNARNG